MLLNTVTTPRFTIPAPNRLANPGLPLDDGEVREWVSQLPMADPRRALKRVVQLLGELNRHPEPLRARAQILAIFRQVYGDLTGHLANQLDDTNREGLQRFCLELAYGYKHLANAAMFEGKRSSKQTLMVSLYFALHFLVEERLLGFDESDCRTNRSFREVLSLYREAETQGLEGVSIEVDQDTDTIGQIFLRSLLIQLLDPCRLASGEARLCFNLLRSCSGVCRWSVAKSWHDEVGCFYIDIQGISDTRRIDAATLAREPGRYRLLDIRHLTREWRQETKRIAAGQNSMPALLATLPAQAAVLFLNKIMGFWIGNHDRRNERLRSFDHTIGIAGLKAVLATLDRHKGGLADLSLAGIDLAEFATSRFEARQINISGGGACLQLAASVPLPILVGCLVLLDVQQRRFHQGQPRLGVVRRSSRLDARTFEIGVQFLYGEYLPILLRPEMLLSQGLPVDVPALWLQHPQADRSSLMLSHQTPALSGRLFIHRRLPHPAIQLVRFVESTDDFERFLYAETS
ncbi:MAG: hypothetical protein WCP34_09165 [Pseudomonadota bacterium]